jgi:8-oxo-dGTP diphosphatase
MMRIGIAIVEHAGRFLVGQRAEDSPLPGLAEFPGGKCLEEETPAECAIRECREETGLQVVPVRLLDERAHDYPHGRVELHFWLCEPADAGRIEETHRRFRWVSQEELKTLDFPEANRHVVNLLTDSD